MAICLLWFLLYFRAKLEGDRLAQPAGKYCSIRHKEYPEFRTEIFGRMESAPCQLVDSSTGAFLAPLRVGAVLDRISGREVRPGRQNLDPV